MLIWFFTQTTLLKEKYLGVFKSVSNICNFTIDAKSYASWKTIVS